jgi:hypothetical protein
LGLPAFDQGYGVTVTVLNCVWAALNLYWAIRFREYRIFLAGAFFVEGAACFDLVRSAKETVTLRLQSTAVDRICGTWSGGAAREFGRPCASAAHR